MRRPWCVALVALLCLTGCVSASPQDRTALTRPDLTDLLAQLQRNPIGPGEDLRITTLVESLEMSGLLVQVRGSLPPHFHKVTQDGLCMLSADGLLRLGAHRLPIKAGAGVRISAALGRTSRNRCTVLSR